MRRHELNNHRRKLREIRDIMGSMKTLAAIETNKLGRFIQAQKTMTECISSIAADFLHFHPGVLPDMEPSSDVILVIGSERGFCGDFNDKVIEKLDQHFTRSVQEKAELIIVGSKLHPLLNATAGHNIHIQGADIAEEIVAVVDALAETFLSYQQAVSMYVLHHTDQQDEIVIAKLLPPFSETSYAQSAFSNPPLLNMPARDFFLELIDHYLFNTLHRILYLSLTAENQYRIQHLENATRHLDDNTEELGRKINALRQEEIIEEIEVILLNASSGYK
jgi:F-type H+-transporting ATPase subunit gamma